jgi:hypothetical protein
MTTEVYEGRSISTIRFGTYSETKNFQQILSIEGRLAGTRLLSDESLLALVHVEGTDVVEPSLRLYQLKFFPSTSPTLTKIYERSSTLPKNLIPYGESSLLFGSKWNPPFFAFSSFPSSVRSVRQERNGKWTESSEKWIEVYDPKELSVAPNGDVWGYFSELGSHGIFFIRHQ